MSAKSGGRNKRPTFTDLEALQFHSQGRPGKLRSRGDQADGDPARPVAGLFAWRRRAGAGDRRGSEPRLRLHDQGQFRRRHHQRHRHSRARQSRRAGRQAGDGRQVGAVQALRRRQFHRSRSLDRRSRRVHQLRQVPRASPGAASTSRTSRRRNASSSSSACASCSTFRSFTTTSTAPPSSPPLACSMRST